MSLILRIERKGWFVSHFNDRIEKNNWLSGLSICLWLSSWSQGLEIKPHMGLPASPSLSLLLSLSLFFGFPILLFNFSLIHPPTGVLVCPVDMCTPVNTLTHTHTSSKSTLAPVQSLQGVLMFCFVIFSLWRGGWGEGLCCYFSDSNIFRYRASPVLTGTPAGMPSWREPRVPLQCPLHWSPLRNLGKATFPRKHVLNLFLPTLFYYFLLLFSSW